MFYISTVYACFFLEISGALYASRFDHNEKFVYDVALGRCEIAKRGPPLSKEIERAERLSGEPLKPQWFQG